MLILLGYAIVIGSIIVGYTMAKGNFHILLQIPEFIIIVGATVGAWIASQTRYTMKLNLKSFKHVMGDPGSSKAKYLETLALLYALFTKMHREGVISIEADVEKPESSAIFSKYPSIAKNHVTVNFIGDTLRVYLTTGAPEDIENLMKSDMDVIHEEEMIPAHSLSHTAESLPGMGIVACVLGVVLTMSKINEPPEVLGHYIAAALVGTFVGILLCYGIVGPMGSKLEASAEETRFYYNCIREAVAAAIRGSTPIIAVEYGRRAIPHSFRPTFAEMEERLKTG